MVQVYRSDPFPDLALGAQYAVTVMALPVPERWESFYRSEIFSTRCKMPRTDGRTRTADSRLALHLLFPFQHVQRRTAWTSATKVQRRACGRTFPRLWTRSFIVFALSADWYPRFTEVTQEGSNITVTFNLAPPHLGVSSYFLQCFANRKKIFVEITAVTPCFAMSGSGRIPGLLSFLYLLFVPQSFSKNETRHSLQLRGLAEAVNYTCEVKSTRLH